MGGESGDFDVDENSMGLDVQEGGLNRGCEALVEVYRIVLLSQDQGYRHEIRKRHLRTRATFDRAKHLTGRYTNVSEYRCSSQSVTELDPTQIVQAFSQTDNLNPENTIPSVPPGITPQDPANTQSLHTQNSLT